MDLGSHSKSRPIGIWLAVGLEGKGEALIEVVNKGGSNLTLALLDAAVRGLKKTVSREDTEVLTNIFSTSTPSVIADAAIAASRRVAIEEFERLLSDNANEHKFQPWFSKHYEGGVSVADA